MYIFISSYVSNINVFLSQKRKKCIASKPKLNYVKAKKEKRKKKIWLNFEKNVRMKTLVSSSQFACVLTVYFLIAHVPYVFVNL